MSRRLSGSPAHLARVSEGAPDTSTSPREPSLESLTLQDGPDGAGSAPVTPLDESSQAVPVVADEEWDEFVG